MIMTEFSPHAAAPGTCLDCGAAVAGRYCATCAQPTRRDAPPLAEAARELAAHYLAPQGKLVGTVRALLLRPGQLSADFFVGRRTRHIHPLRLYLTISMLLFALMKLMSPAAIPDAVDGPGAARTAAAVSAAKPAREAVSAPAAEAGRAAAPAPAAAGAATRAAEPGATKVNFETWLRRHAPTLAANGDRFDRVSNAGKEAAIAAGFFHYGPYALFGTLPLFGLYLKLLYRRAHRSYARHMVFAMHVNGFALLAIGAMVLLPSTLVRLGVTLWMLAYLPIAMRRAYGGGWAATLSRAIVLLALHACGIVLALGVVGALTIVA
jgi:hypothetical protein